MNKREEKIELYKKFVADNSIVLDEKLLTDVTIGLGPSIHNKNSELIACSDSSELATVRENFLKKKLGLTLNDDELDSIIKEVCQEIGSSIKNKYRAVFYTMLVTKLKQEHQYT